MTHKNIQRIFQKNLHLSWRQYGVTVNMSLLIRNHFFDPLRCDEASSLTFISFNMHGFNQGKTFVKSVLDTCSVDFLLIQEHWLSNSGMYKLEQIIRITFVLPSPQWKSDR